MTTPPQQRLLLQFEASDDSPLSAGKYNLFVTCDSRITEEGMEADEEEGFGDVVLGRTPEGNFVFVSPVDEIEGDDYTPEHDATGDAIIIKFRSFFESSCLHPAAQLLPDTTYVLRAGAPDVGGDKSVSLGLIIEDDAVLALVCTVTPEEDSVDWTGIGMRYPDATFDEEPAWMSASLPRAEMEILKLLVMDAKVESHLTKRVYRRTPPVPFGVSGQIIKSRKMAQHIWLQKHAAHLVNILLINSSHRYVRPDSSTYTSLDKCIQDVQVKLGREFVLDMRDNCADYPEILALVSSAKKQKISEATSAAASPPTGASTSTATVASAGIVM